MVSILTLPLMAVPTIFKPHSTWRPEVRVISILRTMHDASIRCFDFSDFETDLRQRNASVSANTLKNTGFREGLYQLVTVMSNCSPTVPFRDKLVDFLAAREDTTHLKRCGGFSAYRTLPHTCFDNKIATRAWQR